MNTLKAFALVTLISGAAVAPMAAHAAEAAAKADAKAAPAKVAVATPAKDQIAGDKNHDGFLSLKEFEAANPKESKADAKAKFASLDKNKDKKLSAEEVGATTTMNN